MEEQNPPLNLRSKPFDGIGFSISHSEDEVVLVLSANGENLSHLKKAVDVCVETIPLLEKTEPEMVLTLTEDKHDVEAERLFKIVLLGDSNSGKTCLCERYVSGTYSNMFKKSIGFDFKVKSLYLEDGSHCRMQVWDTAGTERFRNMWRTYMRESHGVIITADLNAPSDRVVAEVETIFKRVLQYSDFPKTPIIFAGMKADFKLLAQENVEQLQNFADKLGIPFIKCSSLSGLNVATLFEVMAKMIITEKQPRYIFRLSMRNHNPNDLLSPDFFLDLISKVNFTEVPDVELVLYRKAVEFLLEKEGENGPLLIEFHIKQARSLNDFIRKEASEAVQKYKVVELDNTRKEKQYFSKDYL